MATPPRALAPIDTSGLHDTAEVARVLFIALGGSPDLSGYIIVESARTVLLAFGALKLDDATDGGTSSSRPQTGAAGNRPTAISAAAGAQTVTSPLTSPASPSSPQFSAFDSEDGRSRGPFGSHNGNGNGGEGAQHVRSPTAREPGALSYDQLHRIVREGFSDAAFSSPRGRGVAGSPEHHHHHFSRQNGAAPASPLSTSRLAPGAAVLSRDALAGLSSNGAADWAEPGGGTMTPTTATDARRHHQPVHRRLKRTYHALLQLAAEALPPEIRVKLPRAGSDDETADDGDDSATNGDGHGSGAKKASMMLPPMVTLGGFTNDVVALNDAVKPPLQPVLDAALILGAHTPVRRVPSSRLNNSSPGADAWQRPHATPQRPPSSSGGDVSTTFSTTSPAPAHNTAADSRARRKLLSIMAMREALVPVSDANKPPEQRRRERHERVHKRNVNAAQLAPYRRHCPTSLYTVPKGVGSGPGWGGAGGPEADAAAAAATAPAPRTVLEASSRMSTAACAIAPRRKAPTPTTEVDVSKKPFLSELVATNPEGSVLPLLTRSAVAATRARETEGRLSKLAARIAGSL
jgi:hypothetical protein